jgi:hypothetical protein
MTYSFKEIAFKLLGCVRLYELSVWVEPAGQATHIVPSKREALDLYERFRSQILTHEKGYVQLSRLVPNDRWSDPKILKKFQIS